MKQRWWRERKETCSRWTQIDGLVGPALLRGLAAAARGSSRDSGLMEIAGCLVACARAMVLQLLVDVLNYRDWTVFMYVKSVCINVMIVCSLAWTSS